MNTIIPNINNNQASHINNANVNSRLMAPISIPPTQKQAQEQQMHMKNIMGANHPSNVVRQVSNSGGGASYAQVSSGHPMHSPIQQMQYMNNNNITGHMNNMAGHMSYMNNPKTSQPHYGKGATSYQQMIDQQMIMPLGFGQKILSQHGYDISTFGDSNAYDDEAYDDSSSSESSPDFDSIASSLCDDIVAKPKKYIESPVIETFNNLSSNDTQFSDEYSDEYSDDSENDDNHISQNSQTSQTSQTSQSDDENDEEQYEILHDGNDKNKYIIRSVSHIGEGLFSSNFSSDSDNDDDTDLSVVNIATMQKYNGSKHKYYDNDRSDIPIIKSLNKHRKQIDDSDIPHVLIKKNNKNSSHGRINNKSAQSNKYSLPQSKNKDRYDILESKDKHNSIVESKDNIIVKSRDNSIVESKDNIIVKSRDNSIVESKDNIIVKSRDNSIVESKDNIIVKSRDNSIVKYKDKHNSIVESKEKHNNVLQSKEKHNGALESKDKHNSIVKSKDKHNSIVESKNKSPHKYINKSIAATSNQANGDVIEQPSDQQISTGTGKRSDINFNRTINNKPLINIGDNRATRELLTKKQHGDMSCSGTEMTDRSETNNNTSQASNTIRGKKFIVKFGPKKGHQWEEYGSNTHSIYINNKNGPTIHLYRDKNYYFQIESIGGALIDDKPVTSVNTSVEVSKTQEPVPSVMPISIMSEDTSTTKATKTKRNDKHHEQKHDEHKFLLTLNPVGNYNGNEPQPIVKSFEPISHHGAHFKPTKDTPRYFYYQCALHPFEGGLCIVHDI